MINLHDLTYIVIDICLNRYSRLKQLQLCNIIVHDFKAASHNIHQ